MLGPRRSTSRLKIRLPLLVAVAVAVLTASPLAQAQAPADPPAAPAAPTPEPAPTPPPLATPPAPPTAAGEPLPTAPVQDQPAVEATDAKKESKLPWRGSTFLFDQSMTTQTAHLDTSPQLSYVPLYELWFSFRPRYYFSDHVYVWARFDLNKEMTNSGDTTNYREDVFGDIWTDLRYTTPIEAINKNFRTTVGLRAMWPTSKESQGSGIYVTTGLTAAAQQKIVLNGESAKFLNSADLSLSVAYSHPFSRATTPTDPNLNYVRSNTEGRSFVSDQLRGTPLSNHTLLAAIHGGLQITPKLGAGLDMIWINQWHYSAPGGITVPISGGDVFVPRSADDTLFTQRTWFIASAEYALLDELSLGLGYYNLASEIAPNGQRRGIVGGDVIWWSPDARVFFDVTVNLDKFYEWAAGSKGKAPASKVGTGPVKNIGRVESL
jgi:hypothetical protein